MSRVAHEIGRDFPVHIGEMGVGRRNGQSQWDVLVPTDRLPEIRAWRRQQWQRMATHIVHGDETGQSRSAARILWRAALLVASSGQRRWQVRVCVPDARDLNLFRMSGALLGLPTGSRSRPGSLHVVTVDGAAARRLLREVGAGWMADAWVRPSR